MEIENKDRPLSPRESRDFIRKFIAEKMENSNYAWTLTPLEHKGMKGVIRSIMSIEFPDDKLRKSVLSWLTKNDSTNIAQKSTTELSQVETMAIFNWMGIAKIRVGLWLPLEVWKDEYAAVVGLVSGVLAGKDENELLETYDKYYGEVRQKKVEDEFTTD